MSIPFSNQALNGIYPLIDGVQALAMRCALTRDAKTQLDLQYYALEPGLSSRLLVLEIVKAANRGVRVRILLDDMDTLNFDQQISLLNTHPNIEVCVFNPVRQFRNNLFTRSLMFLWTLKTSHRRMHNKLWIADQTLGIIGGRNLADRYFNASETSNFSDLDVLLEGPIIAKMHSDFETYWHSEHTLPIHTFKPNPINYTVRNIKKLHAKIERSTRKFRFKNHPYLKALKESESCILENARQGMQWGHIQIETDPPSKIDNPPTHANISLKKCRDHSKLSLTPVFNQFVKIIRNTKEELILINPYFAPGEEFTALLESLCHKGCKIIIITNSLEGNDVPIINAHYDIYRNRLLDAGVSIHELRAKPLLSKNTPIWHKPIFRWKRSRIALHSKAMISDGRCCFVGSMNLDPRSILWNTETGAFIHQTDIAQQLRTLALSALDTRYCYKLIRNAENQINWITSVSKRRQGKRHFQLTVLHSEPGNWLRKLQKMLGRFLPERYL